MSKAFAIFKKIIIFSFLCEWVFASESIDGKLFTINEDRIDLHERINDNYSGVNFLDPEEVSSFLRSRGYHFDEKSDVQVHIEENYVDLSCFNCIIFSNNSDSAVLQGDNAYSSTGK